MVRSFLLEDATQDTTMSAADTDSSSFSPPFLSEPKGYALSGKIMLSAIIILFAIVVIMVCLHIYARWYILRARRRNVRRARRRTHLVFYIEPNDPSNIVPFPTRGLDASVIKSLPTFVYAKNSKVAPADVEDGEVLECAVCLSEFEEREMGRMLPKCSHCFHVECIDMWLHSHDTCPICRSPVDPADLPSSDIEEGGVKSVELGELTQSTQSLSQLGDASESRDEVGPSRGPSSSFGGRRKGVDFVGVTIEVPRRCHSFSFTNSDESGPSRSPGQAFRSPTSRILSLKRILSREKKSPLPSPSPSASRAAELDVELGRVDPATPASQG